ncbi:uncharacterized protein LOC131051725 [Cryptomeria japonica]|uniref:uncharacterized protein LOC131051725 n=1 Tax=Cryptomeria japonica TaxID=3369 RepID=UPI0027DA3E7D|nr:uncharacterized protein LOC131051725 [Cryptomeria japonica]
MDRELFLALEVRDIDKIQTLHEQDKDALDGVTFQGDTALHIAAREGHQDIVKWILKEKPSLAKARNKDENAVLHEAAKSGNTEVVRLLLQLNQSSNDRHNKFRETALVIASQYGHVGAVKLLLQARPSEDPFEWHRSVREAALRGYKDVVVAMLANTPRCNFTSLLMRLLADAWYKGVIVLMLAKTARCNFTPLLRFLQAWYWDFPKSPILHAAVQGGDLEVVKVMLNHDSWEFKFMTVEDEYGRCAIHVAAIKGHWHIINEFMSRRPDSVNIRSSDGKSVLHFAVEYNQLNVVKCLLANKEAKNVAKLVSRDRDDSGNTALHFAAINGASVEV